MGTAEKKWVLVVDDEESVGAGMTEMLKDAGFNAEYVTSGKGAIEAIAKEEYSLVFIDMVMPGMSGLQTFRKLKELKKGVRVVLFTGFFKDADKAIFEGVKEGMIDVYIRKPFFSEEIVMAARKYA